MEKNIAREVPFIVLRLYLGHSNASLGKLMKMCGNSISCGSLTNRSLIALFFAVLECLFSFDRASGKNHFQIKLARSCELPYLWTVIFYASPCVRRRWLHNRKWRINIWGDQTHRPNDCAVNSEFRSGVPGRHTTNVNKLRLKSNYVSETPAKRPSIAVWARVMRAKVSWITLEGN